MAQGMQLPDGYLPHVSIVHASQDQQFAITVATAISQAPFRSVRRFLNLETLLDPRSSGYFQSSLPLDITATSLGGSSASGTGKHFVMGDVIIYVVSPRSAPLLATLSAQTTSISQSKEITILAQSTSSFSGRIGQIQWYDGTVDLTQVVAKVVEVLYPFAINKAVLWSRAEMQNGLPERIKGIRTASSILAWVIGIGIILGCSALTYAGTSSLWFGGLINFVEFAVSIPIGGFLGFFVGNLVSVNSEKSLRSTKQDEVWAIAAASIHVDKAAIQDAAEERGRRGFPTTPDHAQLVLSPPVRVFISHAHSDSPFSVNVRDILQANGYKTWLDLYDIPPAKTSFLKAISDGIGESRYFLALITPGAQGSQGMRNEFVQFGHKQHALQWNDDWVRLGTNSLSSNYHIIIVLRQGKTPLPDWMRASQERICFLVDTPEKMLDAIRRCEEKWQRAYHVAAAREAEVQRQKELRYRQRQEKERQEEATRSLNNSVRVLISLVVGLSVPFVAAVIGFQQGSSGVAPDIVGISGVIGAIWYGFIGGIIGMILGIILYFSLGAMFKLGD